MRLYIAEKPSMARAIADELGPKGKKEGYIEVRDGVVSWCVGHILGQAPPDAYDPRYKEWNDADLPLIPERWKLIVGKGMSGQLGVLKKLVGEATEIVNAGDPDREGQLIVDEVLEHLGNKKPVRRLWLASLDSKSVREALGSMKSNADPVYVALRESAVARSRADWLVGMNLSRSFTARARRGGFSGFVSTGRVQTPTLALVVARDREIEAFVPKDFFVVVARVGSSGGSFPMTWTPSQDHEGLDEEGRCVDRRVAEAVLGRVTGKSGPLSVETKEKKDAPPLPFSLSGLTAMASKKWGYSAKEVLDAAQTLYERKLTTYPRTDCEYLPENQHGDAKGILAALSKIWEKESRTADPDLRSRAWNTEKVTAHHAIIPTGQVSDPKSLGSKILSDLYDLVVRHYIAQFHPDYVYNETTVKASFAGEPFKATGRMPVRQGWKNVFSSGRKDEEEEEEGREAEPSLPPLKNGESGSVAGTDIQSKKTTPPPRFTDGTLITAMKSVHKFVSDPKLKAILRENEGIGTEATRAAIIEILLKREFIRKEGKKSLVSTPSGRSLIDLVSDEVKSPGTTALWERDLEGLKSRSDCDRFVARIGEFVSKVVEENRTGSTGTFAGGQSSESSPCPSCGRPLVRHKGSRGYFWGCSGYRDTEKPCKTICPDERGKPGGPRTTAPVESSPSGISCPKCGKELDKRKTGTGKDYLKCVPCAASFWPSGGGVGEEWAPLSASSKSGGKKGSATSKKPPSNSGHGKSASSGRGRK